MPSNVTDIEGNWKIIDYPEHSGCIGCKIKIKGRGFDPDVFTVNINIVNRINYILHYHSGTDQWEILFDSSSDMNGSPEELYQEYILRRLISNIERLEVKHEDQLFIELSNGEQILFERLP